MPANDIIERIAREHLLIDTLEERGLDRLDFHDVGVGQVRRALEAAYRAGYEAAIFLNRTNTRINPTPRKTRGQR